MQQRRCLPRRQGDHPQLVRHRTRGQVDGQRVASGVDGEDILVGLVGTSRGKCARRGINHGRIAQHGVRGVEAPGVGDDRQYFSGESDCTNALRIAETTATWLVFGQGTDFAPRDPLLLIVASWNPESRLRVIDKMQEMNLQNLVVLTGDIHRAEAVDVAIDAQAYEPGTGNGSGGVELACNSITSPGGERDSSGAPQFHWSENEYCGYLVVDFTPERMQGDFFGFERSLMESPSDPGETHMKSFRCDEGRRALVEVSEPVAPAESPPTLAP